MLEKTQKSFITTNGRCLLVHMFNSDVDFFLSILYILTKLLKYFSIKPINVRSRFLHLILAYSIKHHYISFDKHTSTFLLSNFPFQSKHQYQHNLVNPLISLFILYNQKFLLKQYFYKQNMVLPKSFTIKSQKVQEPGQIQGNDLASPQQTAHGKDKSNPFIWLETLPKSPSTRKMVVARSLRERYQMGDPTVGPLSEESRFQFLIEYGTPGSYYMYKEIQVPISPSVYQENEERRLQIVRTLTPGIIPLPVDVINNITIRACTGKHVNNKVMAL